MKRKSFLLALLCITTLSIPLLTSCNNDDSNKSITVIDPVKKTYLKEEAYTIDKLEEASNITVMTYTMPNVLGRPAEATALIFYPKTEKPKDGWRIVVWAHGTVGVGDACAPSSNMIGANFKVMAKSLLEEGYIIVAPDYEGLGTKGIHPYLNLKSEALSSIYAVNAMKEEYEGELKGDWMSAGQSQGGQASLGIAEFANGDASFKGAVAGAPASSLGVIILDVAPKALAQIEQLEIKNNVPLDKRNSVSSYATLLSYAGLAGAGIKAYEPDFDYTSLFEDRSKQLALLSEGNNGECLDEIRTAFKDEIIKYMNEKEGNKVMDYPGLNEDAFRNDPIVQKFLSDSQPGTKKIDKPILVIQGKMDTNVPYTVTEKMVEGLKAQGSENVTLVLVEGASHTEAIVKENKTAVEFIKKYLPAK